MAARSSSTARRSRPLTPISAIAHGVQVIFQDFSLFGTLTVAENLALSTELRERRRLVNWRRRAQGGGRGVGAARRAARPRRRPRHAAHVRPSAGRHCARADVEPAPADHGRADDRAHPQGGGSAVRRRARHPEPRHLHSVCQPQDARDAGDQRAHHRAAQRPRGGRAARPASGTRSPSPAP